MQWEVARQTLSRPGSAALQWRILFVVVLVLAGVLAACFGVYKLRQRASGT